MSIDHYRYHHHHHDDDDSHDDDCHRILRGLCGINASTEH